MEPQQPDNDGFPRRDKPHRRTLPYLTLVLLLYAFLAVGNFHAPEEDAFISLRYVKQFVEGNGLVFNAGERVEGYSNFLWVLLLIPIGCLHGNLIAAACLMGIVFGGLTILLCYRICQRHLGRPPIGLLVCLLLATNPLFVGWSRYGMETPLFLFLCALSLSAFQRMQENDRPPHLLALICFLIAVTRPEGLLLSVPYLAVLTVQAMRERTRRKAWRQFAGSLFGPAALFLAFRVLYYQDPLPSSFYAKYTSQFSVGLSYCIAFARGTTVPFLIVLGLLAPAFGDKGSLRRVLIAMMILYALFIVSSGLSLPDRFRVFSLLLLPAVLLAGFTVAGLTARRPLSGRFAKVAICLILLAANVFWPRTRFPNGDAFHPTMQSASDVHFWQADLTEGASRILRPPPTLVAALGRWTHENLPAGAAIAFGQMGQTPYYAGIEYDFVDLLGLNTREMGYALFTANVGPRLGRLPLLREWPALSEMRSPARIVLDRAPDAVMMVYYMALNDPRYREIIRHEEFQRDYRLAVVATYHTQPGDPRVLLHSILIFRRVPDGAGGARRDISDVRGIHQTILRSCPAPDPDSPLLFCTLP